MPTPKRGLSVCDVVIHTNHNISASQQDVRGKSSSSRPLPTRQRSLDRENRCRSCEDSARPGRTYSYHGTPKPVIQYAQLYSFVREKNALAVPYQWDEDSRLQACVAVSRLVQPTTVSLRYAARIRYNSDSSIADISPANIRGVGIDTFPSNPPQRDWLIEADAIRLRGLLQKLHSCPLPDRASRALWYHEYAVRTYYIEIRWVLIATGLEALVHVEQHGSTRQFKCRVSQLASELGVPGLGIAEAERAYVHRSTLAHCQHLGQLSSPDRQLYDSMEATLRLAIIRAIEDGKFASVLKDSEEIKKRWPI